MNRKREANVQKAIRRRALERADALRQKRQLQQNTQRTLDALQEVTGLQRTELESIAEAVTLSLRMRYDDFFSVKNQILITLGLFGFLLMLCGFGYIV